MLIPYPISADYMSHWTVQHAIREILQNAIDSGQYITDVTASGVIVTNKVSEPINNKELLWLGCSNKRPGAIGKFGEGLKLALLILARDKVPHSFQTPSCTLRGVIVNEQFHVDFVEEANEADKCVFTIIGDYEKQVDELLLSSRKYNLIAEDSGNMCVDLQGHVFVNGLLVTKKAETAYGYNFKPSSLELDRDRQTVSDFNLTWETSKLLAKCLKPEIVAELLYKNIKDVQFVHNFVTPAIRQACEAYIVHQFGKEVIIAHSEEEARVFRIFNPGKNVVHHAGSFGRIISSHAETDKGSTRALPAEKPSEVMLSFFERNKKHVRSKALTELKLIVQASTKWTKS